MKIAILTLPLHVNYGGILQAFALQTVLEREGHSVQVVSKRRQQQISLRTVFLSYPKRLLKKLLGKPSVVFYEKKMNCEYSQMSVNVDSFIQTYLKLDRRPLCDIQKKDYDAFVVGSDQIWRPKYIRQAFGDCVENAFLGFAKKWNVKRMSYAASFGTDVWEYSNDETERISQLIKKFRALSVRERSAIALCKEHLDADVKVVLDPTLLLSKEDYLPLVRDIPACKGILFNYILDLTPEKDDLIERISKDRSIKPYRVGARIDDWDRPVEERVQPPVEKWLAAFRDAEFVVTDSFHACVFSIIFGKPFIAIGNAQRGLSRFESLLKTFNLEKNLICSPEEYDSEKDYSIPAMSFDILKKLQQESMDYLRGALT